MSIERWQDKWQGYRTFVLNGVSLLAMVVLPFVDAPGELPRGEDVAGVIDAGTAFAVALVNVVNMVLRALTKTPIFTKG